ncbi:MAG: 30S ribosome-binding factor RbfA [Limnochordia bacterium]|jgi:ribosome-binding factor A
MGFPRAARVKETLKKEIGQILQRELKDPRLGFVTLTDVEVTKDLRYAKAYVSIYGTDEVKEQTMEALKNATGFIRTEIGRRVRLYHTPEITFHLDNSLEHAERVFGLLREINPDGDNDG